MPYVFQGKVCKPGEATRLQKGDVVLVKPATLPVEGRQRVYPPLSVVSESCQHAITYPTWVDGVRVGDVEPVILRGKFEIHGELEVLSPEFLPALVARRLLGSSRFSVDASNVGTPVVSVSGVPILSSKAGKVFLHTEDHPNLLLPLAYSLFYFVSSISE